MIRIFNHYVPRMAFLLLLMELTILLAAAGLAALLPIAEPRRHVSVPRLYLSLFTFALVIIFSMSALGMYRRQQCEDIKAALQRIVPAFILAFLLLAILGRMTPSLTGLRAQGLALALGAGGVLLTRLLLFRSSGSSLLVERLLLVGDGALARDCLELAASRQGFHPFHVVGCVAVPGELRCVPAAMLLPPGPSLLELARAHGATQIVVSLGDRRSGAFPVHQLLECALGGLRVIDASAFFEREACQIRIDTLQPSYLIYGGGFDQSFLRATVKRSVDLAASAAIFIATLPVMLAAALAIAAEDGGPVFYRQERVGRDGQPFAVLKFRSMRRDAERDGLPRWAEQDDPRITRVGHWLRKLRIDELPQILNVLKGEMSFVGPRPERAYFVKQLCDQVAYYNVRHSIKPGITGLAQVRYQYGASIDDAICKLQYDLYYVKNNSLFLDVLILIDTVQVVLFRKGSR